MVTKEPRTNITRCINVKLPFEPSLKKAKLHYPPCDYLKLLCLFLGQFIFLNTSVIQKQYLITLFSGKFYLFYFCQFRDVL